MKQIIEENCGKAPRCSSSSAAKKAGIHLRERACHQRLSRGRHPEDRRRRRSAISSSWERTARAGCAAFSSEASRRRCSESENSGDGSAITTNSQGQFGEIAPHFEDGKNPSPNQRPEFAPSRSRYPAIILQSAEVGVAKRDSKSAAYENRTKSAQSGGLETNGPRERISGPSGHAQCGGLCAKPLLLALFARQNRRRMLVAEGLAEGRRLAANPLRICSNNLARPRNTGKQPPH